MSHEPSYRNLDEKAQDVERYLIRQVDSIRRLVIVAVILGVIAVASSLWASFRVASPGAPNDFVASERSLGAGGSSVREPERRQETPPPVTKSDDSDAATPVEPNEELVADATPPPPAEAPADRQQVDSAPPAPAAAAAPPKPKPSPAPAKTSPPASPPPAETTAPVATTQPVASEEWEFRIGASAIAPEIIDLDPVGAADRFSGQHNQIYCWTRIETDDLDTVPRNSRYVVHRWIYQGDVVRERTISIGSPRYRVYSALGSPGRFPGAWRVEVVDARGRLIGEIPFEVGA